MQRPLAFEVVLLARWLSTIPPDLRLTRALLLLAEVDSAETFLKSGRRAHPDFGDGSLMARLARLCPPQEPFADDPDFLISLSIAAQAILTHTLPKSDQVQSPPPAATGHSSAEAHHGRSETPRHGR